jgi:protein TonB
MTATIQPGNLPDDRRSASLFGFALLFSLALHVLAGGLLSPFWMKAADEKPVPPMTVVFEAMAVPAAETVVRQTERHPHPHVRRAPELPSLPVTPVQHAPTHSPVTVERVEPVPVAQAPAVAPSQPVVVASAPASVTSTGKPQVAPAHFDVAYLVKPQPAYPAMARRLGIEGLVLVRVQVSATGVPEQVSVAQSSGTNALDEEALRAVRESRFEPARRGDTAVAHVVEVPIRFRLRN